MGFEAVGVFVTVLGAFTVCLLVPLAPCFFVGPLVELVLFVAACFGLLVTGAAIFEGKGLEKKNGQ